MIDNSIILYLLAAIMSASLIFNASGCEKMGRLVAMCENYSSRLSILERAVFRVDIPRGGVK